MIPIHLPSINDEVKYESEKAEGIPDEVTEDTGWHIGGVPMSAQ